VPSLTDLKLNKQLIPVISRKSKIDISGPAPDAEASSSSLIVKDTDVTFCERYKCNRYAQQSDRGKKRKYENSPNAVIQNLSRSNFVNFLITY
jgi:hypothetical protein